MEQYISKSALEAEIGRIEDGLMDACGNFVYKEDEGAYHTLCSLENFINTLEVKEVDLEKELESYWKQCDLTWCRDAYTTSHIKIMLSDIAKHFFELGLKAKGE